MIMKDSKRVHWQRAKIESRRFTLGDML